VLPIQDPVFFLLEDLELGFGKKKIWIRDHISYHISESLKWINIFKFLVADWDPGAF
jgi:hypothetical protein